MNLEPSEQFVIVRQLADHTDTGTYYVRATIRDAKTDTLLERVALTDRTSNRFSQTWQVVADPSGLGRWISILTEVFTDDTFTTKSTSYGDEMNTYKVIDTYIRKGGGGGVEVDYKKIKKLIDDAIKNIPKEEEKEISFDSILKSIDDVKQLVRSIEMPEFPEIEAVDLQPIISAMKDHHKSICEGMEAIPGRDKNDIQPLADALTGLDLETMKASIKETVEEIKEIMDIMQKYQDSFVDMTPDFREKMKELQDDFKEVMYGMTVAGISSRNLKEPRNDKKVDDTLKIQRLSSKLLSR